jgi:hypothetical protein
LQALKVVLKCLCKGRKQTTVVGVAGLIAARMPADVLLLEGGQDHETAETDVIKCTIRNVAQKWRRAGAGKPFKNPLCLLPHAGQEFKKVVENTHATPPDKHCKACHMFTMLVSNCGRWQHENKEQYIEAMRKKEGAGPRHADKKWSKTAGRGRVPKWTFCCQVLLFLGKSGTLLQQCGIGMRKVSGFALFARKSHRLCSFSKNGTQGAKKQKAGLIPEYPLCIRIKSCHIVVLYLL